MLDSPSLAARAYVAAVTAAGAVVLVLLVRAGLPELAATEHRLVLVLLGVGVLVSAQFQVRTGDGRAVSASTTFTVALLIGFGPAAAALAQVLGGVAADVRARRRWVSIVFGAMQATVALGAAGVVLGPLRYFRFPAELGVTDVVGMSLTVGAYFLVTTALVSVARAMRHRTPLRRRLRRDFSAHTTTDVVLLGLAPIVLLVLSTTWVLLPLLLLPLVAVHRAGREVAVNTHLAGHDSLTGLPNRMLLQERTDEALELAVRDGDFVALMLLDLDRFKEINDTLGHQAGDAVLREISQRLQRGLRRGDTVARLGGDEFCVLVRSSGDVVEAEALAERLRQLVLLPIDLEDLRLSVDVSIGMAWAPDHGQDVQELMQRADIAMYAAKRAGCGVSAYQPEDDAHSVERLGLMDDLRNALGRGDVEVVFQPQVDLRSGRCVGVEALARWRHVEHGSVPPDRFIPLAEQTGVIVPLTWYVLDEAVRHAARWQRLGLDLAVAVNLSARVLARDDLASRVVATCARHGLPAERLVLEVTESMVLHDPALAARTLERLAELGSTISIDDFGTGYSSLDHLKRLPVGEVKIDRTFIMSMHTDERDRAIVRGTLDLAHALGMRVVAEGVEDAALAADLKEMGCELGQGYHFAAPLAPAEIPIAASRLRPEPATVVYGGEAPAPVVYGAEAPAPVVHGAEAPAPAVHGAREPVPVVYGADAPAPVVYGAEAPAPAIHGDAG